MTPQKRDQARLVSELEILASEDGLTHTALRGVSVFRTTEPGIVLQSVYQPNLCMVAQGSKCVLFGDNEVEYDPMHYLAVTMPLPLEARVTKASAKKPFMALIVDVDAAAISNLIVELGDDFATTTKGKAEPALYASAVTQSLLQAVLHLLEVMKCPLERRVLSAGALKAVLFHALQSEHSQSLQALSLGDSATHRIARIVRFIDENYERNLDLKTMAAKAGMSESSFSHTFKSVTSMAPMQYIKKIRLHRARLLMLGDGLAASDAAFRVGYSSPSQFSREFKSLFGQPPSKVIYTVPQGLAVTQISGVPLPDETT